MGSQSVTRNNKKAPELLLDLGCGTGTYVTKLNKYMNKLSGVDISSNMLLKAKEKNKYDYLYQKDIISFLAETKEKYSLIFASDVTGYLSNIEELFKLVYQSLDKNGVFLFSVETTNETKDMFLSPIGRYLFNPIFVKEKLLSMNFIIEHEKEINLRKEGSSFAKGMIYSCRRI